MTPQDTLAAVGPSAPVRPAKSKKKQDMAALLEHRWARLLVPSLSDLFFIAVMCWLFMGSAGWMGLLRDADVGWHIRTGQYILAHHAVPHQDLYSFSKPGATWYAWEWLSDVIDGALFQWAGFKGVVLTAGVVIALFGLTLLRRVTRLGLNLFASLLVALVSVGAASVHYLARPHLFTLLLLSISMWMLETDRDGSAPRRRIFWLVPLSLVWTNLHGGFLILIAIVGMTAIGAAVEAYIAASRATGAPDDSSAPDDSPAFAPLTPAPRSVLATLRAADWKPALRYLFLAAACGVVTLVNPYGWQLHVHIVEYLRSDWIRNVIQEFQSPSFRAENMLQFEALLFAGLIAAGALFRRARVAEGLWILLCAYLALSSARHVPVFVVVTAPLIAVEVASWWDALTRGASKNSLAGILNSMAADSAAGFRRSSLWPAAFVLALAAIGAPLRWPADFPEQMFPTAMVHAHEAEILQARVLTTDQWGDYLIFLHPDRQKVFIDGRSDFYGPEVGDRYLTLSNGGWEWRKWMDKYQFNLALLPVEVPLAGLLKQRPEWRVVADDGKHILLVLRENPVSHQGRNGL